MKINEIIHGFRIIRSRTVKEKNGTLYELEHTVTGTKLAWLERSEKTRHLLFLFVPSPITIPVYSISLSVPY